MQLIIITFLIFSTTIYARESFISNDEYAKMIYKNPRGIGCDKCHGERGEGKVISSYISGKKKISLIGPRINNLSSKKFLNALKKGKRLMPEYFLTDDEKAFLYYYLTKHNQKGVKIAKRSKK
jgi:hypothetical protein